MISSDKAEFLALWVETLLYGIFFAYFQQSIGLLTWRRTSNRINWILVGVSLGIFALATAHLIVVLCRALQAFIDQRDLPGGPVKYYNNLQSGLEVSQASCQIVISFLGDGMVIYRVWVVYSRNYWILVLPMLSYVGTTVSSVASVVFIGKASSKDTPFYLPDLEIWLPAFFGLTFATSVLCSMLIAGRLWYIDKKVQFSRTTNVLTNVLRIVIESASIYSLTMLIYLTTYVRKSNVSIIFGDMVSPVIGIAFSLITIRVHNAFNPDNYDTTELETRGREAREAQRDELRNTRRPQPTSTFSAAPLSDPYPLSLGGFMTSLQSSDRSSGGDRGLEEGTKMSK